MIRVYDERVQLKNIFIVINILFHFGQNIQYDISDDIISLYYIAVNTFFILQMKFPLVMCALLSCVWNECAKKVYIIIYYIIILDWIIILRQNAVERHAVTKRWLDKNVTNLTLSLEISTIFCRRKIMEKQNGITTRFNYIIYL